MSRKLLLSLADLDSCLIRGNIGLPESSSSQTILFVVHPFFTAHSCAQHTDGSWSTSRYTSWRIGMLASWTCYPHGQRHTEPVAGGHIYVLIACDVS